MTDLEPDSDSDAQPRVLLPEFLLNERELAFITAKFPEAMAQMRGPIHSARTTDPMAADPFHHHAPSPSR